MSRRMTAALVLLFVAICTLSADPVVALKSKLAVQPQDGADTHVDHHDHVDHHGHDHDEADTVVRCRFCGAAVALKKYGRGNLPRLFGYADAVCARMLTDVGVHGCRDYIALHDTSKAVASKRENILGDDGELHTFVNPSRMEMALAGFRKTYAVESDVSSSKATFFDNYNWRDVRCSSCKRHLGWKFHHDELQQCINTKTIDSIAAKTKAQENLLASTSEKERKAQIVEKALKDDCVIATAGWWSYQVCYKKEVRQYHEDADGTRPSDWSMGVYVEDDKSSDTPDLGTDVVQYFAGGQHCDENGELRSTKVVYTCCKTKPQTISIDSVEEPSLCSYIINVCIPELCGRTEDADGVAADTKKYTQACEQELAAGLSAEEASKVPTSFTTLRWSTVISEDSSELDWARSMQFKA